jgi:uncharacterized protein
MTDNESASSSPSELGGPSAEEKQWAMFAHLSAFAGVLLTSVFGGWGSFIGPLVIWLMKKDTMPFASSQAKEALNFNIMISAIFLILFILTIVTLGIGALLTVPVMLVVGVAAVVLTIMAAIKANSGVEYRYPFTIRVIK